MPILVASSLPLAAIPRLTTARLLLRQPRLDDFEAFAADAADPVASVR